MAKRVSIIVDVSNFYYSLNSRFGRRLHYGKFLEFLQDFGEPVIKRAYGAQLGKEAEAFISRLQELGFEPIYKIPKVFQNKAGDIRRKADWDVGIAIDIIKSLDDFDLLILGTADSDLAPLVEYVLDQGKQVVIFACGISSDLRKLTETMEIPQSILE